MSYPRLMRSTLLKSAAASSLVLMIGFPLGARAQSPDLRLALEHFRDSLAATSDSNGLLVLEKHLIDSAKADRNNTYLHLKLGFVSLKLGEMGGHSHYDDAASE